MKVYSCPEAVQFSGHDFSSFDMINEEKKIEDHKEALKAWLKERQYTGKLTGEIVGFSVADGEAQYMIGDPGPNGRGIILVHLPYWDAYNYPYVNRLTKRDIVEKLQYSKKLDKFFKKG